MLLGDLIEVVADTGQSKSVVDAIVRGVLVRIEGAVGRGETVNLVGFGRFEAYQRGARHGRNVQTRESLRIPETRAVRFKIGKRRRHCRCRIKAPARREGQEIASRPQSASERLNGAIYGFMVLHIVAVPCGRRTAPRASPTGIQWSQEHEPVD